MPPRQTLLLGLLVAAALAAGWMMSSSTPLPPVALPTPKTITPAKPAPPVPPASPAKPVAPPPAPPTPAIAVAPAPAPSKTTSPPPTPASALDARKRYIEPLEQIGLMLRDYRTLMHENPVGTNAEIMAAVMGGNPRHARLGPPAGATLNDHGELLDQWGTPYFFHQMSAKVMEIHSAGPDRQMWTPDDIVSR